nr:helix-turn-helix transcriptional regulator [Eubacterium sp.]
MTKYCNQVLGKRLRKARRMLGVTSEEMSEMLHLSAGHYRKLERGEHAISLGCLQVLHEVYGMDLNYIITGHVREEDVARELVNSTPEEAFYYMHQLLESCERVYMTQQREKEAEKN